MTGKTEKGEKKDIAKTLNLWLAIAIAVATILGFLLTKSDPIGKSDISVWIKQEIPVQIPDTFQNPSLSLVYNNELVSKATMLEVEVINTGKSPIGENGKYNSYFIECDANAKMVFLASASNPPLDYLITSENVIQPHIHADVDASNRIPNFSRLIVTREEPIRERLTKTYQAPILYIVWIGLIISWLSPNLRRQWELKGGFTINPNINQIFTFFVFALLFYFAASIISGVSTEFIIAIYQYLL